MTDLRTGIYTEVDPMPLTLEERLFLKTLYGNIADKELKPGDPRYQPVYEGTDVEDPVDLLQTHIEFCDVESLQMFSGFRGSGKTTELFRLQKRLEDEGYLVLYADALEYVNPSEPVEISDLLITIAGSFSDALTAHGVNLTSESYWDRIWNYLTKTDVDVKEAGLKLETLGPIKSGVDLKATLKTTPTFRQELQTRLAGRIRELHDSVTSFIEEGRRKLRMRQGPETKIVFLFDSLEQIRGSLSNEQGVIRSVERLFANHLSLLRLPYVHVVYTVPPWLKFVMPGNNHIVMLPNIQQWCKDPERSAHQPGCDALRSLVLKRFGEDGIRRFFGDDPSADEWPRTEKLINLCGGHFRDLLLLLRETALRAKSLPVSDAVIDAAIVAVRGNFLPIAVEDARWLARIEKSRSTVLQSTKPEEVARLTRFLDTHFVLYLKSGEEWYDIHPLIREEVAAIAVQHPEPAAS